LRSLPSERRAWLAPVVVAATGLVPAGDAFSQQSAQPRPPQPPPFETLRYNEDYSYLKDPGARSGDPWVLEPLKYIPLDRTGDCYLTLGGDIREQYEIVSNPSFGLSPEDEDGYLLHLYLLHADLHLWRHLRLFVQGRSATSSFQENVPGPGAEFNPDLHQLFADLTSTLATERTRVTLRAGRQEMAYGAQRMISVRPTIRRTFDAVRVLTELGDWRADAFFGRPVEVDPETFEHEGDERARFWGIYAAGPTGLAPDIGIDIYYLGLDQPGATFELGEADQPRHSVGLRLFGKADALDFDVEGTYQWGELGSLDISAWRLATEIGYSFESTLLRPRAGLLLDVSSGDEERGDGRLGTFIPLFPKGNPFGASPLIGPVNLITVQPLLQLHITDSVALETGWSTYWRQSTADGVYNDGLRLIQPPAGNDSPSIGSELSVLVDWRINRNLSLSAKYSHFFAGTFLEETGPGEEVDYFSVFAHFLF